jgi:hypothetical protein
LLVEKSATDLTKAAEAVGAPTGDSNLEFQIAAVYRRAQVIYNRSLAARYLSVVHYLTQIQQTLPASGTG